ncbi:hypothetical protein DYU05_09130 [Mucilaginibacter terrenus]|uniref:Uncharacterized protein n=1 Tax=Mucilaginibacter terrenus TaxID=2482727 RepID=A0A3E2NY08_9SPHI|nr:hypothetical protein [Mucilaginibacter terrenus]RFZ85740.1 hypothetical protein DYU05_09130 [Mucilaginibacter terrenus]
MPTQITGLILLLGLMLFALYPLMKKRRKSKPRVDTDTRNANYAINADGKLERIRGNSFIND